MAAPYTPHPTHILALTRSRLAMAFPSLGIQCLMCFLLTMPMRKENVPRVQCPEPCLSRRHRMTCQTRNCSDLGNHCPCPCPSSSSSHHSVVFLLGNIDYCCGQRSFPRICHSLRFQWPCALTTGIKSYDIQTVQNDTQYLCYSFL